MCLETRRISGWPPVFWDGQYADVEGAMNKYQLAPDKQAIDRDIDATNCDLNQKTLRRPDKSDALKKAHQAAAYDKWFKEQIKEGIAEADSEEA